jgi:hypothetical protein
VEKVNKIKKLRCGDKNFMYTLYNLAACTTLLCNVQNAALITTDCCGHHRHPGQRRILLYSQPEANEEHI